MPKSLDKYQKRKNDVGYRPNIQNNTFIISTIFLNNLWFFKIEFVNFEPHSIVIITINKVIFMSQMGMNDRKRPFLVSKLTAVN